MSPQNPTTPHVFKKLRPLRSPAPGSASKGGDEVVNEAILNVVTDAGNLVVVDDPEARGRVEVTSDVVVDGRALWVHPVRLLYYSGEREKGSGLLCA